MPTEPSGYSVRILGIMPFFNNNPVASKCTGKFLDCLNNEIRIEGNGFDESDSTYYLILFLIYK